jgi:hypothetical protein
MKRAHIAVTQETIVEPARHAVIPAAAPKQEPGGCLREVNGDLNERAHLSYAMLDTLLRFSSHYAIYVI